MMRYRVTGILVFVLGILWGGTAFGQSGTTDNYDGPHNTYSINMRCDNCHLIKTLGANAPFWYADTVDIDDDIENRTCWSCHSDITAHFKEAHSSISLGDKYNAYDADPTNDPNPTFTEPVTGRWHVNCIGCHWGRGDTHGTNNSQHASGKLATGTYVISNYDSVTNRTTITMTEDGGQEVDGKDWSRYIFVANWPTWPELNKWKSFKVLSSVDTNPTDGIVELTVMGDARGNTVDTCYLIYGKYQNAFILNKSIVFYDQSGPNSFLGTAGSATDGVCEVCHVVAGQGQHPADEFGNDCKRCHMVRLGFAPDKACNECHGLSTAEGQNGYGAPLVAGQVPAGDMISSLPLGVHQKHVVDRVYPCVTCHNGNGMPTRDSTITMSYTGLAVLNSSPVYDPPGPWDDNGTPGDPSDDKWQYSDGLNPLTSTTATQDCNNVYCHSTGQGDGEFNATPVYSTPDWGDPLTGACGTCHGINIGVNLPTSGSHTAHLTTTVKTVTCSDCHAGVTTGQAGDPYENAATHVDGLINVDPSLMYESSPTVPADGTPGNEYGNCYNASCHNNGITITSPKWGTSVPECTECHLSPPNDVSHNAHINSTVMSNITCSACHDNADNLTVTPPGEHLDTNIDVYDVTPGDLGYPPNVAFGSATWTSCLSTATSVNYCHDNGFAKVDSPVWGSTGVAQCSECHDVRPTTSSHPTHLNHATVTVACGDCHNGAIEGTTQPAATHLNGTREADGDCSVCHTATMTWGTDLSTFAECTRCHDSSNGASRPLVGADTQKDWAPGLGAHARHLNAASQTTPISADVACVTCHAVPATVGDAGHIKDGTTGQAEIAFANGAFSGGSFDTALNTCNNTYCHASRDNGDATAPAPDFYGTLPQMFTLAGCKSCHGVPPSTTAHLGVTPNDLTACVACHTNVNGSGTAFVDYTLHVNASLEVQGCTACHGMSGTNGAPLVGNDLVGVGVTTYPTTGHGIGAHVKHAGPGGLNIDCNVCHSGHGMEDTANNNNINTSITITFTGLALGGAYDGATLQNGYTYAGADAAQPPVTTPQQECSNIYCHSDGKGVFASPDWEGDVGALTCTSCHGNTAGGSTSAFGEPSYGNGGTGTLRANSHANHVSTSADCDNCHLGNTHANGTIDVTVGGYVEGGAETCSTGSCHDVYSTGALSPAWGGALANPADCSDCHGNDAGTVTGMGAIATNKHTKHLATFNDCAKCHDATIGVNNKTLEATAPHADGTVDVVFDAFNTGGVVADCSNLYCHSDGKGVSTTPPAWTGVGTLDCTGCHGNTAGGSTSAFGEPSYASTGAGTLRANSHGVHVSAASDCDNCHLGNNHVSNTIDVNHGYVDGVTETCATAACHGSWGSPAWGTDFSAVDGCTRCHGTPSAAPATEDQIAPVQGAHQAHLTAVDGYSLAIACVECHVKPAAVGDAGHIQDGTPGTVEMTFGNLADGGDDGQPPASPTWTAGTCSNTYCHDGTYFKNGYGPAGTDPAWTDTTYLNGTSADCGKCHGYPPAAPHAQDLNCTNCHPHVAADNISFKTVGPDTVAKHINGTVEGAGACDACHGYPPVPLDGKSGGGYTPHGEGKGAHAVHIAELEQREGVTLDPNADTFGSGAMAAVCGTCHDLSVGHQTGIHVDPSARVDQKYWFDPINPPVYNGTVGTSSGTPDNIPKTCTNISCHFTETPVWAQPGTE